LKQPADSPGQPGATGALDGIGGAHPLGGQALPAVRDRRAHKAVEAGGKVGTVVVEPQL